MTDPVTLTRPLPTTLIDYVRDANARGDLPTATDLADGLGRPLDSVRTQLQRAKREGRARIVGWSRLACRWAAVV